MPVDDSGTVAADTDHPGGFVVRGSRPERWVAQTDFDNDEAVGYRRPPARLGVEEALFKRGAKPGCAGDHRRDDFEWEPQTPAGADVTPTDAAPTPAWNTTTGSPERKELPASAANTAGRDVSDAAERTNGR